jgi:hypothetical protein
MPKIWKIVACLAICLAGVVSLLAARGPLRSRPKSQSKSSPTILSGQSSTVLPNGDILLLGGEGTAGPVTTASLKDSKTGTETTLSHALLHARTGHSATLLPDGSVFIFGGIGTSGAIESAAELFDPTTEQFKNVSVTGLTPRAYHTATVLTDGRVLFAGGTDGRGGTLQSLDTWDYVTEQRQASPAELRTPTSKTTASLLGDGTVLFWGGIDANGLQINYGEIFDPNTNSISIQASPVAGSTDLQLNESKPADNSVDVSVNVVIALRFSKPLQVQSVNGNTIFLNSATGNVSAKVIPTESGMLAFVTPAAPLDANTAYTLTANGVFDATGAALPSTTVFFTTAAPTTASTGTAGAIGVGSGGGGSGGTDSTSKQLPALQAPPGVTAIAGQVLQLNGSPLDNVTLSVGSQQTKSDGTGRFLLKAIPPGHQVMVINAGTANKGGMSYGLYEDGVDVTAGTTNVLGYTIWMAELDMAHATKIPSPTTSEVIVKTPALPGLELHIPANTTITADDGTPVTQISLRFRSLLG